MNYSKLTQKGQATIPADVRKKLHLHPGDRICFKIQNDHVLLVKVKPFDAEYHQAVAGTLSEWDSDEDDAAYEDL